jgi:hypothetical protein
MNTSNNKKLSLHFNREKAMENQTGSNIVMERRKHPNLRAIFTEAKGRLEHVFNQTTDWAGSDRDYLALRVIHEAYPELNADEVRILTHAIERRVKDELASRNDAFRLPDDDTWVEKPGN